MKNSEVVITDMTGRTMDFSYEILSTNLLKIDVRSLNSGIYTIIYIRNGQKTQEKFVLAH